MGWAEKSKGREKAVVGGEGRIDRPGSEGVEGKF